ncbi:hypothetical protein ACTNBL_07725 [Enterococcus villorum]|jgi:hypothetical protein|uniref:Uncharacterized protein n=2 Tax=Enterococcus villorum TaxID=112904 RepID=A0A511J4R0_9ENTE|nr:hypothetical protein [Enterococcus villorum]EOH88752.1 hypothetical protein UAO_01856 [Enterococcus villorum ATCC 700913]EOW76389.1 hypothetical protein I591_01692 [Enterococcus villorum ATCC 700913]GEL92985.1 hypothetical protein EVI01_23220 [Enterococcus villorum]
MNTYIKVTNGAMTDYFYAFVEFKESMLELSTSQGLNKKMVKKIPLEQISELTKDTYLGGQRISFEYNGTFYQFFECGHAVVDYLQENLFV